MEHTSPSHVQGEHAERFREHAEVGARGECWAWRGHHDRHGYASSRGKTSTSGHRIAYLLHRGSIPAGMVLDHLCRNRGCVNPWHLEVVTSQENTIRQRRSGLCRAGLHEMTGHNVQLSKDGYYRRCRACNYVATRKAARKWRAKKKAEAAKAAA